HFEIVEYRNSEGASYRVILHLKQPVHFISKTLTLEPLLHIPWRWRKTGESFDARTVRVVDVDGLLRTDFGQDLLYHAPSFIEAAQQDWTRTKKLITQS